MRELSERHLFAAGCIFAVGSLVHVLDHLRRGQGSVTEALYWAGNLALIFQVVIVVLVITRHPSTPRVAAIGGPALAAGFAAAHWLPPWGPLSDPVWMIESGRWLSYGASAAEILGALAVSGAAIAVLRAGPRRRPRVDGVSG